MAIGFTSEIIPNPDWGPVHSDNPDFTPYEDDEDEMTEEDDDFGY